MRPRNHGDTNGRHTGLHANTRLPRVITVMSQKGGTGKTTIAIAMAVASARTRPTALIDLDAQGSAVEWAELRGAARPALYAGKPQRVKGLIGEAVSAGAEEIVIDTSPRTEHGYYTVVEISDAVVIPAEPAGAALLSIAESVRLCRLAERPSLCVINRARVRHSNIADAVNVIRSYEAEVCPVVLHNRIDHEHAFTEGQSASEYAPKSKAAGEADALTDWITQWADQHGSNR